MVKLIEIKEVPKKIDEALIVVKPRERDKYYNDRRTGRIAFRDSKTIFLDSEAGGKFYSLMEGKQFIYTGLEDGTRKMFFGGMDESPFLVELQFSMMEGLVEGEESFFESLKPANIRRWEARLENRAKRQGDFFAIASKKKVNWGSFFLSHLGVGTVMQMSVVKDYSLKSTRHKFDGILGIIDGQVVGEGTVSAPDHEPLLLNEPHLIEQSIGFVRPQEAD